jgi:hypothetical protein
MKLYNHLPDEQSNAVLNALEKMNAEDNRGPFTHDELHQAKTEVQHLVKCLNELGYQVNRNQPS